MYRRIRDLREDRDLTQRGLSDYYIIYCSLSEAIASATNRFFKS